MMFQPISAFPGGGADVQALSQTTMPLSFESPGATEEAEGGSFSDALSRMVQQLDEPKQQADKLTTDMLTGKPVDIHEVMIAQAQGDLALQMASSVVSKVAGAYQTLVNMQV